ncbi:PEP-utilizing enzyme [Allokutzneria sp. A3M-2-11 16]|uniref:PEP/pyruvate-binding domain-containing protein n=1 Tax=Allokutzneria sp. A3M-2-11 16 TaxID=2962043 RepID=UPI0020B84984|nr:PEP/pyruvate-binding domain-containing protein [Allokutzneria sp. A3M-2-11 16]MCP3804486.1 PEP-utilizing enzyme [Allokutzneria sp. A3M-2-11 16]
MTDGTLVLPLDAATDLATVGGKGLSLAKLARAGFPVPTGFHVTTHAYRRFASARDEVSAAIRDELSTLDGPVAVRSSATAEDLPGFSFAGQYDSFLDVVGADAVLEAVERCWASLWNDRATAYRDRTGISSAAMAVVVQRLVPAESAGVLFTANPLTGDRDELVINAARGLGEALVSGEVTPDTYVVAHGQVVRTVPDPVLTEAEIVELARLGERVAELHGMPMDVEWARHDGEFWLVQARPITGLDERADDSHRGDYLWTSTNVGEAIPSVMTPATWSLVRELAMPEVAGHPLTGNIGGRFYLNLSVPLSLASALGLGGLALKRSERVFGQIGSEVEIPRVPMSRGTAVRAAAAMVAWMVRQALTYRRRLGGLLAENPKRCKELHRRIGATDDPRALAGLWRSDVAELLTGTCRTLEAGARQASPDGVAAVLRRWVGDADAAALMTGLHDEAEGALVSLGPVLGLARLRRGEVDREDYLWAWGHRCPDEFEVSAPRPAEDPEWLDRQLAGLGDPEALLRRQAGARDAAWRGLRARRPLGARLIRLRLDRLAEAARVRERARSEFVRGFWVFRVFAVRAGELTGLGDDVFFLSFPEIVAVLDGDRAAVAKIAGRRAAHLRYRALPPYPTLIRGRFDPNALDRAEEPGDGAITGFPGVAGVVEGSARVVSTVEEAESLLPGEILVAVSTNIGWTPLFPRAAAVVTDIGAPLSHAVIVARELGIPAVVGCGTATARLATGDRIRVDGLRGTVSVLG